MRQSSAPGLGELLRHLTDLLDRGSEARYRASGLAMRARYTPLLRVLGDGPQTVSELQQRSCVTQGAVSQTIKLMESDGLVSRVKGTDARSRRVSLTRDGEELRARLLQHWAARLIAIEELEHEVGVPLRVVLADAIEAMLAEGFEERIARAEISLDSNNRDFEKTDG
ncbi:MarR family winged helix-turn-helix transcriptional regulator [Notoacmeibacter marinus]|uniref:MarR family winged helix-turn-helix transcriptional regulator n=1 Tax=Notoacmeibacter marinus TaxID=1876515 RepID=UPI0013B061A2|nr:MarR family transcriptional regulator [Notoacmeibacter marinus]